MNFNNIHKVLKNYIDNPKNKYATHKLFKDLNNFNTHTTIKKHYPKLDDITDNKQLLYHAYHKINKIPECSICGNIKIFKGFSLGYSEYCSKKCQIKYANINRNIKKESHSLYFKATSDELKNFLNLKFPKPGLTKSLKNAFDNIEWYNYIKKDGILDLYQLIYMFINDIEHTPKCPICNKDNYFINMRMGFSKTCSSKCNSHLTWDTMPDEKKNNMLKKSKDSFIKTHGKGTQGNKKLQEKKKLNSLRKWGTTHYLKSEKGKKIFNEKIYNKYGVYNVMHDPVIAEKNDHATKSLKSYTLTNNETIQVQGYNGIAFDFLLKHYDRNKILHEYECKTFNYDNRMYRPDFEIIGESQIYEVKSWWWFYKTLNDNLMKMYAVLKENYDFSFLIFKNNNTEYPIELSFNNYDNDIKDVIDILNLKKEKILYTTDGFLLIDHGLCIKYIKNLKGYKDYEYTINFRKESNQYCKTLIIYEDQFKNNLPIIKSRLNSILGKNKIIYARKCIIRKLNSKISKSFLNENHMQGSTVSKYNYGLYYNDELVSIMTFGDLRKSLGQLSKESEYELLRFCNKLNYNIVGGASKLLNHFIKKQTPKNIISYADYSWSDGGVYEKLGFNKIKNTTPGYWYIVNDKREHRYKYNKQNLVKMGYDINKTEKEIMTSLNIPIFYDCGNLKYLRTF